MWLSPIQVLEEGFPFVSIYLLCPEVPPIIHPLNFSQIPRSLRAASSVPILLVTSQQVRMCSFNTTKCSKVKDQAAVRRYEEEWIAWITNTNPQFGQTSIKACKTEGVQLHLYHWVQQLFFSLLWSLHDIHKE